MAESLPQEIGQPSAQGVSRQGERAEATKPDGGSTAPRVTIITEIDGTAQELEATALSLEAQTFGDWEWLIVTTDASVTAPLDSRRIRVVRDSSRIRAVREAAAGNGDIALLDAGQVLPPTALEKWVWFLEGYPECLSVHSTSPGPAGRAPRLIRRTAVDEAGGLDAAAEIAIASTGFVPLPDRRPESAWLRRQPDYYQSANEWLPQEHAIDNLVATSGRRLLLVSAWMTVGGVDKFILDLLDQLDPLGWEITVATTIDGPHELYPEYERRTPDLFPLAHFLPLPYQPWFLQYLIRSRRPDAVLICNSELGYRLLPYLRGMCPNTPIVDFCHSETEHWNNGGYPRFSVENRQSLDLTMTSSAHLKQWMVERGGDEARIEVCHTNVDTHVFQPTATARAEVRGRLRLPGDEPIVLFLGRISADKQPRVLSAALTLLFKRGLRFTPVIVGDGPERGWLEAALRDAGVGDRVRMLGSVENDEIPPLMAGADIFFIPSRSEGISVALYEAMASGTAVVGARVGGQAELVTEDCGVLVERSTAAEEAVKYADAIESLLRDPERCAAMGQAARARAEADFPLERLGARVNELLETAIESHATNPQPVPTETMARSSATEAIELMRLASLMDAMWGSYGVGTGLRSLGVTFYVLLRRVGRPAYLWGLRRGWRWLPRMRDQLARVFTGYSA